MSESPYAPSFAASSSASDSDFIETPVHGPGTHVPNLALDNVEEEDCPFVYMHILNEMIAAKTNLGAGKDKSVESDICEQVMNELVHVAADVYVPRYKLLALPHPSSPVFLSPILELEDREVAPKLPSLVEVLARLCTPLSTRRDDVDIRPVFPGKLVVPGSPVSTSDVDELVDDSDDGSFPVYGTIQEGTAPRSKGKRKRDEDPEKSYQARSSWHLQTALSSPPSAKRSRRIEEPFSGHFDGVDEAWTWDPLGHMVFEHGVVVA
ncbi:hypothetical protein PENSPDRAFT_746992 [Peniophora sp. CONT]|nr:hypothetical protein PENSPDRAFT_746992 [Peniophora sp. CONT]